METFQHYSVQCISDMSTVYFQLCQFVFDSTECYALELTYQYIFMNPVMTVCALLFGLERLFMVFDTSKLLIITSIGTGIQ